jgi:hypothetical protein
LAAGASEQRTLFPVRNCHAGVRAFLFDLKTLEVYRIVLAGLEQTA